jgi:hypothetical protein
MSPLPSQAARRRDVILFYVSYPVGTIVLYQLLGGETFYALSHLLLTVALLTWFGILRIGRVGKRIADDADDRLDERQISVRNAAYLDAYRIVSAVALLGCIWIALGLDQGWWWVPSTYNEWNAIFWGLFLLTTSLPSAFLSWREPDRPDDSVEALQHA